MSNIEFDPRAVRALYRNLLSIATRIKRIETLEIVDGISWGLPPNRFVLSNGGLEDLRKLSSTYAKRVVWRDHFSETYIQNQFLEVAKRAHTEGVLSARRALNRLLSDVSNFNLSVVVCVPLAGVTIRDHIVELEGVKLVGNDHSGREYITAKISDRTGYKAGEGILEEWSQHFENYAQNSSWMVIEVAAEPIRAASVATASARRILEVMSFVSSTDKELGFLRDSAGAIEGELPVGTRSLTYFSTLGLNWSTARIGPQRLEISQRTFSELERVGALRLVLRPSGQPDFSDFERAILNAIHWYTTAQSQTDHSNALLFLFMALEAILNPSKGHLPAKTVPHHASLLVAIDESERRDVRSYLIEKYEVRSQLAHGQVAEVTRLDVEELRAIVTFLIRAVLGMRPSPSSTKELHDSIEKEVREVVSLAEVSNRIDPVHHRFSIKSLRQERGLSERDLADLAGMTEDDVKRLEDINRDLDFSHLVKVAEAMTVRIENITLSDRARIVDVEGHKFLIVAEYRGEVWEPVVKGWSKREARKSPIRPPLDEFPDVHSPSIFIVYRELGRPFLNRFYTLALDDLEVFIRNRLEASF